jgi:hypothetical protein
MRQQRTMWLRGGIVAAASLLAAAAAYLALSPGFVGSQSSLLAFVTASVALVASAIWCRPSVFTVVLTGFLTCGFLLKSLLHLVWGVVLIEPVGSFAGSAEAWDTALGLATAGLAGATLAVWIASLVPAKDPVGPPADLAPFAKLLLGLLALLLLIAVIVYAANYELMILRIGHTPTVHLGSAAYGVFAFCVTWGFLLAGISLTVWLVEAGRMPYAMLVYIAGILGLLAAVSMSSRVQAALYLLAAAAVLCQIPRARAQWRSLAVGLVGAAALFGLSLAVVTIERVAEYGTILPPAESAVAGAPLQLGAEATTPASHAPGVRRRPSLYEKFHNLDEFAWPMYELRSLFVMRWIGLEGVLVTAGQSEKLGRGLFVSGLAEEPSAGTGAIFQRMAGDRYIDVKVFTFLTIPGVIGFGSYSGSYLWTALFTFLVFLIGHFVETFAARATRNAGAAAVAGVAMAYLVAQFNVPWTLFIFIVELLLALVALALFRQTLLWCLRRRAE